VNERGVRAGPRGNAADVAVDVVARGQRQAGVAGTTLHRRFKWSRVEGYLFVAPFFLGFLLFTLGPFVASLVLSFTKWTGIGAAHFVGLRNYQTILTDDPKFRTSIGVTLYYMAGHIPLAIALAVAVALLLNQPVRGIPLFRTLYYLPSVTASVATAILWAWLFDPTFGLINQMLALIGIHGPNWLGRTTWAMPAFIIMSLWGIGELMVIYLAALQGVPGSLYDAASIDGAGRWRRAWHVTLPMTTPAIFLTLIIQIIGSFQVFTSAFILTNGGPGDATLFYVLYLYQTAFQNFQMGYASALAWILFVIIMGFTLLQVWLSRRWVYYEGEQR
jgi:multiple sugar transport system permease protein